MVKYFFLIILLIFSNIINAEEEAEIFIEPIDEKELNAGAHLLSEINNLKLALELSLEDSLGMGTVTGVVSGGISNVNLLGDNGRKNPNINNGYYTINGNKDIVILGHEKQMLYTNAKNTWDTSASFTLNVTNVGYLTYNNVTLCDVDALISGENYSEFIYGVTINGFSTNYEYRLELNNGQVTIWSKLPGQEPEIPDIPIPPSDNVPEPKTVIFLLSSILLLTKKTRN